MFYVHSVSVLPSGQLNFTAPRVHAWVGIAVAWCLSIRLSLSLSVLCNVDALWLHTLGCLKFWHTPDRSTVTALCLQNFVNLVQGTNIDKQFFWSRLPNEVTDVSLIFNILWICILLSPTLVIMQSDRLFTKLFHCWAHVSMFSALSGDNDALGIRAWVHLTLRLTKGAKRKTWCPSVCCRVLKLCRHIFTGELFLFSHLCVAFSYLHQSEVMASVGVKISLSCRHSSPALLNK